MKRTFLGVLLLFVFLGGCSFNTEPDSPQAVASSLSNSDLAVATILNVASERAELTASSQQLDLRNLPNRSNGLPSLGISEQAWRTAPNIAAAQRSTAIETQGSFPERSGFAAYIQRSTGEANVSKIIKVDMSTGDKTIIYEGDAEPESVALSADGSFIVFTAKLEGNYEVFIYDGKGSLAAPGTLIRVTSTEANESNVSMSLDGTTILWQGVGSIGQQTPVAATISSGEATIFPVEFSLDASLPPIALLEPSVSGDGGSFAVVVEEGLEALEVDFPVILAFRPTGVFFAYANSGVDSVASPSMTFSGGVVFFAEVFGGVDFVSAIVAEGPFSTKALKAQHPFATAGGGSFIYSSNGTVFTANNLGEPGTTVSDYDGYVDTSPYWAREPNLLEEGITVYGNRIRETSPSFVRPDNGSGLSDAGRTVFYHAESFEVPFTDLYSMFSTQNFDGYLLLYKGAFDPTNPTENLIAQNDDYPSFFDDEAEAGSSRIISELEPGQSYTLVTTAFGSAEVSEPYHVGGFTNTIASGAAPPPPPITLPDPDPSKFNITVIFANDPITASVSAERKAVFVQAAERWSQIITDDIADIENFTLASELVFPGIGELQGTVDDVVILARFGSLNGPLGSAGPVFTRTATTDSPFLTVVGLMQFEVAEFDEGGFFEDAQQYEDVIVHEMGHVIGIGTLWDATGNVDENYIASNPPTVPPGLPNPDYDPGFTGPLAQAEYAKLTGLAETVVPIANTGGPGNYNGHWRELTFNNELMTPYAGGAELLSRITAASLGDIGYVVDIDSAAVDQDYELSREIGVLEQVAPSAVSYTKFEDYLVFSGSGEGDVTAAVQAVDINLVPPRASTSGCEAEDFADFTEGNIALLQRGTCTFVSKVANAQAAGAVAVVMFNQGDSDDPARTGIFGAGSNSDIPAVAITYALGETLAGIEGLQLRVSVEVETGPIATAALEPRFEEEVLRPIGQVDANGKITYLDAYLPVSKKR